MIKIFDNFFPDDLCKEMYRYMIELNSYHENYADYSAVNFFERLPAVDVIEKNVNELNDLKYERAWSFIYRNHARGVMPHADPSTLTFTVWITPDESILNHRENGLNIWTVDTPKEIPHQDNGTMQERIFDLIKDREPVKIPYKYNRAILFESKYLHATDCVSMKHGIENQRVNYTFLFS